MWSKVYLTVLAEHRRDGTVLPRTLYWADGRRYEIDRVKDARPCAAPNVGGHGIRYTAVISGQERHLFREGDRWFIEHEGAVACENEGA